MNKIFFETDKINTLKVNGYVVVSAPFGLFDTKMQTMELDTFRSTKSETIAAAGCNSKQWKELYRKGYRIQKMSLSK